MQVLLPPVEYLVKAMQSHVRRPIATHSMAGFTWIPHEGAGYLPNVEGCEDLVSLLDVAAEIALGVDDEGRCLDVAHGADRA